MTSLWKRRTLQRLRRRASLRISMCRARRCAAPISICGVDRAAGTLRFVFQIRGEGTRILAGLEEGQPSTSWRRSGTALSWGIVPARRYLWAAESASPPLLEASKAFGKNATAVLGFRNRDAVILEEDFRANGCEVRIATDDGSMGHHGLVTDCLKDLDFDVLFACGPTPMLKAVCAVAKERGVECQISLEERMACGIGACLGCACKLLADGREYLGHVCKDGPVFPYQNVVLD